MPAKVGDMLAVVGDRYTVRITGAETGGRLAMFDFHLPPGGGPPLHVHANEDEIFYVLSGELTFYVRDERLTVRAGESLHAVRNVPHRFRNESAAPVTALCIATPAGLEDFFAEVGTPLTSADAPIPPPSESDIARILAIAPRYGIQMLAGEH